MLCVVFPSLITKKLPIYRCSIIALLKTDTWVCAIPWLVTCFLLDTPAILCTDRSMGYTRVICVWSLGFVSDLRLTTKIISNLAFLNNVFLMIFGAWFFVFDFSINIHDSHSRSNLGFRFCAELNLGFTIYFSPNYSSIIWMFILCYFQLAKREFIYVCSFVRIEVSYKFLKFLGSKVPK